MDTDAGRPDAATAPGNAPLSTTREYAGIAADALGRSVERALADRADGDLEVRGEDDGSDESATDSLVTAVLRRAPVDAGAIPYRPYGPHSAMAVVVGFIFMIPTIFISLLVSGVALYFYYRERPMDLPLERRDVVRVLVEEGEAADDSRGVTVTYVAEPVLSVDADAVATLGWPKRIATTNYVNYWHDQVADEPVSREVEETVVGYLTAWADRDPDSHADTVRSLQASIADDPDRRRAYTDLLADQLPGVDEELEASRESLRADLEAVADEVALAVDGGDA